MTVQSSIMAEAAAGGCLYNQANQTDNSATGCSCEAPAHRAVSVCCVKTYTFVTVPLFRTCYLCFGLIFITPLDRWQGIQITWVQGGGHWLHIEEWKRLGAFPSQPIMVWLRSFVLAWKRWGMTPSQLSHPFWIWIVSSWLPHVSLMRESGSFFEPLKTQDPIHLQF